MALKIVIVVTVLALFVGTAPALEIGGELQLDLTVSCGTPFGADLQGRALVELFLPERPPFAARFAVEGLLAGGADDIRIKYLYLRWRGDNQQLTIGRSPLGWGYGSMINLFGFGMDMEGFAGESTTPVIDGLRYVYGLGSGRRLELAADFSSALTAQNLDALGYGGRLRWPGTGRDISISLSSQPLHRPKAPVSSPAQPLERLQRAGVTYRGDAGPVGVYGALGYVGLRNAQLHDLLLQAGFDASWQWNIGSRQRPVLLQAEYMRFFRGQLDPGLLLQLDSGFPDNGLKATPAASLPDLLAVNAAVSWDYFTQFGTALMLPLGTGPKVLAPYAVTDLGGDVQLRLQGSITRLEADSYRYGLVASLTRYF